MLDTQHAGTVVFVGRTNRRAESLYGWCLRPVKAPNLMLRSDLSERRHRSVALIGLLPAPRRECATLRALAHGYGYSGHGIQQTWCQVVGDRREQPAGVRVTGPSQNDVCAALFDDAA